MNLRKKVLALSAILAIVAPQAEAAAIFREFNYYTVSGKTAADLDRALSRNGPFLKKTGQHHPGAAEIRFDAKVRYGRAPGKACKVQDVYVNVHAKVSLPRWKQRRKATPELALIWDTLLQDIRRHEESHIVIARSFASEMERKYADCAAAQIVLCFALTSTKSLHALWKRMTRNSKGLTGLRRSISKTALRAC